MSEGFPCSATNVQMQFADAVWLEYNSAGLLLLKKTKRTWLEGEKQRRMAKEEGETSLSAWN